jgi:addiction module HigA family antidote
MDKYQLNPTKLAHEIGLSQPTVRQIAIGKSKISASAALRFAKFFGTRPEYWLDLQKKFDLVEADQDKELVKVIKNITKATKIPEAKKAAEKAPKSPAAKKRASKTGAASEPKKRGRKPRASSAAPSVQDKPFVPHVVLLKKKDETPEV